MVDVVVVAVCVTLVNVVVEDVDDVCVVVVVRDEEVAEADEVVRLGVEDLVLVVVAEVVVSLSGHNFQPRLTAKPSDVQ